MNSFFKYYFIMNSKIILITTLICLFNFVGFAQKDTSKRQTIDITSSYKPVLRNAVKINFSATNLTADTSRGYLTYSIPAQNLFYTYQPIALKPLALTQDTALDLGIRNFLKIGFGNYSTPFLKAGFSFGDGKKSLVNVYADYISSKGKIKYQDYSQLNIKASGSYFTERNEIYGTVGLSQNDNYLYAYNHNLFTPNKADVLQRFSNINIKAGFKNKDANETGINYNPNVAINVFSSQNKLTENSIVAEVPVEKTINDVFSIKLAARADITTYTTSAISPNNFKFNNNIFSLSPEIVYATPLLTIHGGVTPTWDNNKLAVLPNFYGEFQLEGKPFLVQAGLVGSFIKNTYQYLAAINPYLLPVTQQINTQQTELYGGIKGSVGSHFNYSAKAGFIGYKNLPFFINDTITTAFKISNEPKVTDVRIHGDMSFISQDKFTITGGLTFNGYTGLNNNRSAWGTIPIDINAAMKWWAFKQVMLKADFRSFTGNTYLMKGNAEKTLSGAADLSAGVEVEITKKISAWFDANNLFNNKYQRWYGYEVYGLNVLAGVIVKF